jgi:hypothetical protein
MLADPRKTLALVEQLVALGKLPDHLLGRVTPLLHAVPLAQFWSIGTLSQLDQFRGDRIARSRPRDGSLDTAARLCRWKLSQSKIDHWLSFESSGSGTWRNHCQSARS